MFTPSRILAFSLFATLASAVPSKLALRARKFQELAGDDAFPVAKRAPASVFTSCSVPNTAAITFDDGPYIWNTDIVNTLAQYNAKGTFFVNGNNYGCIYTPENEQSLKTAFAAGHQIASHTWAHLNWSTLTNEKLASEMSLTDTALIKILGIKPAFVRPPFGEYTNGSRDVAAANGQSIVIWDFDSGDSVGATVQQSETDYQNLATKKPASILTLNHETYNGTAHEVLPFALNTLKAAGYSFVTVAECLGGMNPYQSQTTPAVRDATWAC